MADRKAGEIPTQEEMRRRALEAIRRLERQGKVKKPSVPLPKANPELWPGGPSVDTGDIRLAGQARKRRARRGSRSEERRVGDESAVPTPCAKFPVEPVPVASVWTWFTTTVDGVPANV